MHLRVKTPRTHGLQARPFDKIEVHFQRLHCLPPSIFQLSVYHMLKN